MHAFLFLLPHVHVHSPDEGDLQINNDGASAQLQIPQLACADDIQLVRSQITTRSTIFFTINIFKYFANAPVLQNTQWWETGMHFGSAAHDCIYFDICMEEQVTLILNCMNID